MADSEYQRSDTRLNTLIIATIVLMGIFAQSASAADLSDLLNQGTQLFKQLQTQQQSKTPNATNSADTNHRANNPSSAQPEQTSAPIDPSANKFLPDTLGIRVGMTAIEANEILKKQFPLDHTQRALVTFTPNGPQFLAALYVDTWGRTMSHPKTTEKVTVKFAVPPNQSRVIYLGHSALPTKEEPLSEAVLTKALIDKFGTPFYDSHQNALLRGTSNRTFYWFWNSSGKPATKIRDNSICESAFSVLDGNGQSGIMAPDSSFVVNPNSFNEEILRLGCTTGGMATVDHMSDDGLVSGYRVVVLDIEAGLIAARRTNTYLAERKEADKQKALGKANANAPKL